MASLRFLSNELTDALYELMRLALLGDPKDKARVTKQKVRVSRAILEITRSVQQVTPIE
jgi:hypothetical protein